MRALLLLALLFASPSFAGDFLPNAQRILFLGDSITASGEYVDGFEAYLFAAYPERKWEVINAGLPSETVSGLSEEGHADGKFPRPDLHERLDRVLEKTKPELIFVCYGMNDGIYLPLSEDRFARFREGMEKLRTKATAAGAEVIHITPPVFDAEPIKNRTSEDGKGTPFRGYDAVLEAYSRWLLSQREHGWRVIDLHGPMRAELDRRRAGDPGFYFAKDGVHPSPEGHALITRIVVESLEPKVGSASSNLLGRLLSNEAPFPEHRKLIREREQLLMHAWLTETGHQRPGIARGLPLLEAQAKAAELEKRIRALVVETPAVTSPTP